MRPDMVVVLPMVSNGFLLTGETGQNNVVNVAVVSNESGLCQRTLVGLVSLTMIFTKPHGQFEWEFPQKPLPFDFELNLD